MKMVGVPKHFHIKGDGGLIRDHGTLDFLVDRVNSIDDSYQKAAQLLYSIAAHHPFYQGNKRTALIVAEVILIL